MNRATISTITSLGLWACLGGPAQATLISGWDFSQFFGDGTLSINNNLDPVNALGANYSHFDDQGLTPGLGPTSATYGTLYFDGTNGSTLVDPSNLTGLEAVVPSALGGGVIPAKNLTAPVSGGFLNPFDSQSSLQADGQEIFNLLNFKANALVDIVFTGDLTTETEFGTNWALSFGGITGTGESPVGIEFSTNGTAWNALAGVVLNGTDTLFSVPLTSAAADKMWVRMHINPVGTDTRIDNVAISATAVIPEPATALLLACGLAGLLTCRRRLS